MAILDTRASGPISSRLKWMIPVHFEGVNGSSELDLHGFDITVQPGPVPVLKILLINHRPPINPDTRELMDATKLGANSTIELFEARLGESQMRHQKTYAAPEIETPNNVAFLDGGTFLFSNDRSNKVGLVRLLTCLARN